MKKVLFVDAVGLIDTDLLESYVAMDQRLRSHQIAKKRKSKRYLVTLLAAALAMLLCVALLVTSLPLIYVFNAEQINTAVSEGVENILFPLDKETEDGEDINPEDLLINWVEWKFAEEFFKALGAGTDDSVIDKMQSMQGGTLAGDSMQSLGDFLAKLYEYYLKHKDGTEPTPDEKETESEQESETEPPVDPSYEVDGSKGLKYQKLIGDDGYAVSGLGDCEDEILIIPASYDGQPVTEIWSNAFGKSEIVEVIIPDTVTEIGNSAFRDCGNLERVQIPDSVNLIGERAFENCISLTSIKIPDSVTTLETNLFSGCISLSDVTFSDNVQSIKAYAFYGCRKLLEFTVPETCTELGSLFVAESGVEHVTILSPITTLPGGSFFECRTLTSVVIPDSVENIGNGAFQNCVALQEVVLPDKVHTIGIEAFSGCASLISVNIPSELVTLGERAFYQCGSLEKVRIPKGVATIERYTFALCNGLREVVFEDGDPATVEFRRICERAFTDCTGMEVLVLPNDLKYMEESAFVNCSSLLELQIPGSLETIPVSAFYGCSALQKVEFGYGVKEIGGSAFYGCSSLEQVDLNGIIYQVGNSAFYLCKNLKTVNFGKNVNTIGRSAFESCLSLTEVNFAQDGNLIKIEDHAFAYCRSLQYIALPESLFTLGRYVFEHCPSIQEVIFPESISFIPSYTFQYSGMVDFVVSESIDTIRSDAFYCASQLRSITLHVGVKNIQSGAFEGCESLTHIYYDGTLEQWRQVEFGGKNYINITVVCSDGETIA